MRDIIKKIPKLRGFGKNRGKTHVPRVKHTIALSRLEAAFNAGDEVSLKTLIEKGLAEGGHLSSVKIVGTGSITKKLTVRVPVSSSARAAIEKAGGTLS
jgi:ribosomal protein L15